MDNISVHTLAPGELVLITEKVTHWRDILSRGQQLPPIEVYNLNGQWIVRNGNNRVRAQLEHWRANDIPTREISCQITLKQPTPSAQKELCEVSSFSGVGEAAFASLPVVPQSQYYSKQKEQYRKMRARKKP